MATSYQSNTKQSIPTKQTVSYKSFDTSKLEVGQLADHQNNTAQKLAMFKYKTDPYSDSLCQIQTPNIKLFTYGIPKAGPYYPTDEKRGFIKIPEDVNDPNSVLFFSKMSEIDTFLESTKIKNQLFGDEKKAAFYKYQPIVRTAEQVEEDDDNNPKNNNKKDYGPRPRYIKVKVDFDWTTKEVKSKCYVKDANGKREPINDIKTLDDLAKYVRYRSTICVVMMMNKLYASKAKVNGESKKYGATFKLSQVVCEPQTAYKQEQGDDAFIDDDDSTNGNEYISNIKISKDTIDNDHPSLNLNSVKVQLTSDLDKNQDDDDNDDNDDDDDDDDTNVVEEVKPVPVVQVAPTPAPAPVKTTAKRVVKKT